MPTETAGAQRPPRRAKTLADDACPQCGKQMSEATGELPFSVNGEEVRIPDLPHSLCPECGEVVLRHDQVRDFRVRAIEQYRQQQGLLSAREIRAIRKRFGLTQGDMARLLRLGGNTISRWESGRTVQTAALDILLRLIRDLPGSLDYLRRHAA